MSPLRLSVVIITHNRASALETCLHALQQQTLGSYEIIVVDNGSSDNTQVMLAEKFPHVRVIVSEVNLGIAAGRNKGYFAATGDICVTLDDDATLHPNDALEQSIRYFDGDPALACVSFDVRDNKNCPIKHFIPRRDRKAITDDRPGAFFVGTGHAMHRKRFMELGGFWEDLGFYFGEEPELSYRILEAGYHILHSAHIIVWHEESTIARPKGRRIYHGTRNVPWIAIKNLPWHSVCSLTILAWGYYFLQALRYRCLVSFIRGIVDSIGGMRSALRQRRCVSKNTITLLKRYSGVYLY